MLIIISCRFCQLLLLLCKKLDKKRIVNSVKEADIKNRTFYFFHDMFNIKNIDPNEIKIDEAMPKYFYLLHWIRDGQKPQLRNN